MQVPEAASYYSLEASTITWKFPEPGYLEGVKTKDKAILKMTQTNFKYPGAENYILQDVNVQARFGRCPVSGLALLVFSSPCIVLCTTPWSTRGRPANSQPAQLGDAPALTGARGAQVSLSSRVGCIGANGAGKSTLIKILTGELETDEGLVWRHPNVRIAYVAQHAFHHIEKHLDKTPNQYIQWRYVSGEDREEQEKTHIAMTEDEIAKMHEKIKLEDGTKRSVEKLVARRKAKGGGYECAPPAVGHRTFGVCIAHTVPLCA